MPSPKRYKAVLFAPDGDWVTDFRGSESIREVQENLADMGSRWIFYPFHAVIVDRGSSLQNSRQKLVDVAYPFEDMKGRTIYTFSKFIADYPREELEMLLS
jgi:hypothetical protein